MAGTPLQIVVGLGKPGPEHRLTRHNAGFWFVDAIARAHGAQFRSVEVTRQVRLRATQIPALRKVGILILSAYDDDPYIMSELQAGANGYVLKTAAPAEIIQAVRDVHAGKSALDSTVAQKLIAQLATQATPSHSTQPAVEQLTEREMEVLTMVARGFTNKALEYS